MLSLFKSCDGGGSPELREEMPDVLAALRRKSVEIFQIQVEPRIGHLFALSCNRLGAFFYFAGGAEPRPYERNPNTLS